ncbi:unnamed protein product [Prorocentrum cordatum]|uniref:TIR domain-containing protein n=1 Tax=Prorocentrum cordatum TaxID=2364126 RepID=A0ABN9U000_9DINO|nr:unnamed protein product [Polarella glacialis]
MDRVAARLAAMGYEAWSMDQEVGYLDRAIGRLATARPTTPASRSSIAPCSTPGEFHRSNITASPDRERLWLSTFAKKLQEPEVVGLICILSSAYSKSQHCLQEMQYAIQQCSRSKGILLLMYEEFAMTPEMMFMTGSHHQAVVFPRVRTQCQCLSRCECAGDKLSRAAPVSEEWLTDLRPGCFTVHVSNVMMKNRHIRQSSFSRVNVAGRRTHGIGRQNSNISDTSGGEWDAKIVHQQLLEELIADMNLASIDDFLGFVGIIGSTAFFNPTSERICCEIGVRLASALPDTVAVCSGGFTGTGECISRAFHDARVRDGKPHRTYMVLPTTDPDIETVFKDKANTQVLGDGTTVFAPWDYGMTVFYGRSNAEKMAIMAVNSVLVMVEGGPGALKEALGCQQHGHWVVPVRCTGGATTNAEVGQQSPFHALLHLASEGEARWQWVLQAQQAWELLDRGEMASPTEVADAVVTVVRYLLTKQAELEQSTQMSKGVGSAINGPRGLRVLNNMAELTAFTQEFSAVVLFSGFGSKGQYDNMSEVEEILEFIVKDLDAAFGKNWLVMYGGSPYLEDVRTIAHVARLLRKKYEKILLAIQCDFYGNEMLCPSNKEEYAHMEGGALYTYKTQTVMDEHFHKKFLFGGYYRSCMPKQDKLCGASSVWYGSEMSALDVPNAHVIIGGGSVAADDAQESYNRKIPTFYARTRRRKKPTQVLRPKLSDRYGQMEHWANALGLPREEWFPRGPDM